MALAWKRRQLAESADATGTEISINNQDNKRAAEESGGAQQPSASKKQRRTKRMSGGAKRAQKRSAHEAHIESNEREAGGGRQKGNLKKSE